MSRSDHAFDIIVVGLGPVGCLAAYLLAQHGLRVAAIEKDTEVYKLPRAVALDGEIIRAFQPYGTAEALFSLLQKIRPGDRSGFADSNRNWLFGREARDFSSSSWQSMHLFDQPEVEDYLRRLALEQGAVTDFVGYEASHVRQEGEVVTVVVTQDGETQTLSAPWLIACDGASSPIRKQLDIEWQDLGYDQDWLVVDVEVFPGHTLKNETLQVCDPDRIHTFVCTKDPYRRWEFRLNEGETWDEMLEEENIFSLIDPWTPRGTYKIRRAAMYQFHAATARTWQVGRVLIAGDAAHQTPPFLGQGMNTGMRDVINLAWKLPLVINGEASEDLIHTYEQERVAHAHDFVDWAVSIGRLMEHLAEVEAAERVGNVPPELPAELKASGYGQGRDAPPLRDGVIMHSQVEQPGIAGSLYRQPIVKEGEQERRFDDVLGSGFALVTESRHTLDLSESSLAVVDRLNIRVVALEDYELVRGKFSDPSRTILVRPDRYIFGHTDDTIDVDNLIGRLKDSLALL